MPPTTQQLLERARRELLDLSTRNRLLSIPVGSKSARLIEVHDERGEPVFRLLATERRVFGFLPGEPGSSPASRQSQPQPGPDAPRNGGTQAPSSKNAISGPASPSRAGVVQRPIAPSRGLSESVVIADEESAGLPPPDDGEEEGAARVAAALTVADRTPSAGNASAASDRVEAAGAEVPARRHVDARLQTTLTPEVLQRRLLDLYRDARTMIEEQGVNVLYLAVGQLKWVDPEEPDHFRHAPLILVPVELARRTASDRFQLSRREDEIQDNLSLAAKLKMDFGLILPAMAEEEEFKPAEFMSAVSAAVKGRDGWEVLPDAMALGFFSFAKFLMYRDLDPANWPTPAQLLEHPLVGGLMLEGFPAAEPLWPEDTPLDECIPVSRLDHVVDADGSQTLAIEAVRQGRSVVIQGPPGTGKSQSITNLIATAVLEGKRVLFVAEKLAALEVVKRRLEREGLGPLCLELHSNKANKRAVLDEIGNTWRLGKPRPNEAEAGLPRLEKLRSILNDHARDLHAPHPGAGLSPFRLYGELLRLGDRGRIDDGTELVFEGRESWTSGDRSERRRLVVELAERVERLGVPRRHPWFGVRRGPIQKLDLPPLATRIRAVMSGVEILRSRLNEVATLLGEPAAGTFAGAEAQCRRAAHVAIMPAGVDTDALASDAWDTGLDQIRELVDQASRFAAIAVQCGGRVIDAVWARDFSALRGPLAAHGKSWRRWLNGEYRRALSELRGVMKGDVPATHEERVALVDRLVEGQAAAREIGAGEALGKSAFGNVWRGTATDGGRAMAIWGWVSAGVTAGLNHDSRRRAARIREPERLVPLLPGLTSALEAARAEWAALARELAVDVGALALAEVPEENGRVAFGPLLERGTVWLGAQEELIPWTQYHAEAARARELGLGPWVDRLESGATLSATAVDVFDRAESVQLWRELLRERPGLAGFDGARHEGCVGEFRQLDRDRLGVARFRTLAAHFERLPPGNSGVGAAGIVKSELERKRGHRAVRRLLRDAGSVVQAIKPVFMMSPLSVAQYLEPGAVEFDLLVIDEASQVQPVDALGAIARCRQMVVVGDSRQLPPTRFFARLTSGESTDGEDCGEEIPATAEARDIESILGLCCARGLPQIMLRWHYRSRHHSLIAVSNREFYENRLFIVPSPYSAEAGLGLKFHHVPDGVFDSGGSGSNRVEAKVVCRAILQHARRTPQWSLGVAAFSVRQQQAILDELELLRRESPESESFFSAHPTEPFFVKNLENVQGDERDVMFISVGYGRDVQGTLAMRFGPLAVAGGERRLNVLISRAKRRCDVFSSITAEDIDLGRSAGRGVAALKSFLGFAQSGRLEAREDTAGAAALEPTLFEDAVRSAVESLGYAVHPRVGIAGFFVDLAVLDPEPGEEGRYLLGIELDGPGYASARSARDRDRLRPALLSDHGWVLYRIWSADWFQRPEEHLRRLGGVLSQAKAAAREAAAARKAAEECEAPLPMDVEEPARTASAVERVELPVARETAGAVDSEPGISVPYREARVSVPRDQEPHALPDRAMARILFRIVEEEGPVHEDELVTRVRDLWQMGRAGPRVQDAVAKGVRILVVGKQCSRSEGFLSIPEAPVPIRDRSAVTSANLRKIEFLPPEEVRAAVMALVTAHHGAKREELPGAVARMLGFRTTTFALRGLVGGQLGQLVARGLLEEMGGMMRLRSPSAGTGVGGRGAGNSPGETV